MDQLIIIERTVQFLLSHYQHDVLHSMTREMVMLKKTSTTPLVPLRALFVVYIFFMTVHL